MPVFEEDIEAATDLAIVLLGPQGRMLESAKGVTHNAILATESLGRIWYGDLETSDSPRIIKLSEELKEMIAFVDPY